MRNNKKKHFGRKKRRGLSLIEILVAVTIIALFSGLVGVQAFKLYTDSQIEAAGVEVKNLSDALDVYRLRRATYPSTGEGLAVLASLDLVAQIPTDPWGNSYVYVAPGQRNPKRFDLFSKGPDGVEHTDDDVW